MKKMEQLYEGKAKKVFATDDPDILIVDYKDDATAFNGEKKGTIVGKGVINNKMTNHVFQISGRNPYKEEFVTCGGVALTELHPATLECKRHPGLYFAGEVADVDAITGGFNLQAAWTMAYVVAKSLS